MKTIDIIADEKSFKTAVEGYLPYENQRGPNNTDIVDNVSSKNIAGNIPL